MVHKTFQVFILKCVNYYLKIVLIKLKTILTSYYQKWRSKKMSSIVPLKANVISDELV